MTKPNPVLIVEDDTEMAKEMAEILKGANCATDLCHTFEAGVEAASSGKYPVVILDRMLPDGDGADAIARLRAKGSNAMVLVVSALGRASNRIEGLEKGADDYLAKPFDPDELRARVRSLLRRADSIAAENDFMVFGSLQIRLKARNVHVGQTHVPLSPREFDLLVFFARNHGELVTRMQLLENVWNLHFDPQTNVVDVHVSRLRGKLDRACARPVLHTARGEGYIFDPMRPIASESE